MKKAFRVFLAIALVSAASTAWAQPDDKFVPGIPVGSKDLTFVGNPCACSVPAACTSFNSIPPNPNILGVQPSLPDPELPVLGTTFSMSVDCTGFAPGVIQLMVRTSAIPNGAAHPFGWLLVGGAQLSSTVVLHTGGFQFIDTPIPCSAVLCGMTSYAQVLVTGPSTGPTLSNALALRFGR